MALKVYRIDKSIVGAIFNIFRKTDIPLTAGIIGGNLLRAGNDLVNFDNHYVIKNDDELSRFSNPLGNSWIQGEQYYIRHPKQVRERWLIEAQCFHDFIYREQISEIISYLRSNFSLKHLEILSENENSLEFSAKVPIEELQIEGEATISLINKRELIIDCPRGLKVSEKRSSYIWIDDFQELKAVVDDFNGGEFSHVIEVNNSFGMGLKECNTIGVKAGLATRNKFSIKFKS